MEKLAAFVFKALMLIVYLLPSKYAEATTYYFSSTAGDDSRSASEASNPSTPWQSIQKFNQVFRNLQPGDSMLFKCGDQFYGGLELTASGIPNKPIVIAAYGSGSRPVITGFTRLTDWSGAGIGIYEAALTGSPAVVHSVVLNGNMQAIGRFPNADAANGGYLNVEEVYSSNSIRGSQLPGSYDWRSAEIVVRKTHWVLDRNQLTSVEGPNFQFNSESGYGAAKNFGYFVQNHRATLDREGEWYHDRSNSRFGMYFGQQDPSSSTVEVSTVDRLLSVNAQHDLLLDQIVFKGANEYGFYLNNATNIHVYNALLLYSGNTAIKASGCRGIAIIDCSIDCSNNNACDIAYTTNLVFRNNKISNTGTVAGSGKGDSGSYEALLLSGDDQVIENNVITNTGYIPITFNGNDIKIRNNYISGYGFVKDDGGGIYTWNNSPNPPVHSNRLIENNIVADGSGAPEGTDDKKRFMHGIYMDDNADHVTIKNNTISNCGHYGFYIHNAHDIIIENNTSYNNGAQVAMIHDNIAPQYPITNVTFTNNINVSKTATQPVALFKTIGNDLSGMGNFDNNVYSRPLEEGSPIEAGWNNGWGLYDLEGWKKFSSVDKHSSKSPVSIAPYSITGLAGSNKYYNGRFDSNINSLYSFSAGGSSNSSWSNSGSLDGGALKLSFTSLTGNRAHASIIIGIGQVDAGKTYILRYDVAGATTPYVETYLRKSLAPYNDITTRKFSLVAGSRTSCEVMFTATETQSDASIGIDVIEQAEPIYFDNIQLYQAQVKTTNPDDSIHFVVNNEPVAGQFPLDGDYVDVRGNTFSGSVRLEPFTSAVLLKKSLFSLPVEFSTFTADKSEAGVKLQWELSDTEAGEVQQVERSSDGRSFRKIGELPGLKQSGRANFSFTDMNPGADNYYRIKYVPKKSKITYTRIVRIKYAAGKKPTSENLLLGPNPAINHLNLTLATESFVPGFVTIQTAAGSLVKSMPLTKSNATVDLSGLQNGTYVLSVLTGNGVISKLFQKGR